MTDMGTEKEQIAKKLKDLADDPKKLELIAAQIAILSASLETAKVKLRTNKVELEKQLLA
ncbi:MAG: hypothetical protein HY247_05585 [archaeon]|nr:MAG: hypothetical protein HY247_05585 [archaeon]